MENTSKVSVVMLNWNRKEVLMESIQAVLDLDYPVYEVIVVDNASTDGSQQAVKESFPNVTLVENDKNYGAIGGKNIGLRKAIQSPVDYIYMVDNDIVGAKDSLSKLIEVAEADENVGMVGAMMYDMSKPDIILSAGGTIDYTENVSRGRGDAQKDVGQFDNVEQVDYLWGGALLARKSVLEKVGLFDPGYIGYWFEDTDLSVRVTKAGYKILFSPFAKVWHKPHATIEQFSYRKKYLATRNAVRFMKKHAPVHGWIKYLFFAIAGLPYALVRDLLKGRGPKGAWGKAKGLFDGILERDKAVEKILGSNFKKDVAVQNS
ncbi:glycosyltransferase [candidate division KSB1 bacterium]|nr:glycosyltransferase [candidate division KSB1 bacterium]